jgi:hypothetical protein
LRRDDDGTTTGDGGDDDGDGARTDVLLKSPKTNQKQDVCARSASFDLTAMQRAAAIADVRRAIGLARERGKAAAAAADGQGGSAGGQQPQPQLTMAAGATGGSDAAGTDAAAQASHYDDLAMQLSYAEKVLLR